VLTNTALFDDGSGGSVLTVAAPGAGPSTSRALCVGVEETVKINSIVLPLVLMQNANLDDNNVGGMDMSGDNVRSAIPCRLFFLRFFVVV
jgi:hypothetical protein